MVEDFVVVSSRDREDRQDVFSCLDAQTGVAFWQHNYAAPGNLDYGNSPRATPVIADPYVIVLGAFGDLHVLDLESGDIVWKKNLIRDLGGTLPQWGYAASPIVVEEKIIVQPGGTNSSVVALDLKTGGIVWKATGRRAAYASPVVYNIAGRDQVIGFDATAVVAWDAANGNKLWEVRPTVKNDFNVPSPVLVEGGLTLTSENNATRFHRFDAMGELSETPSAEFLELAGDSHTPIRLGSRLIGVDRDLIVLDLDRSLGLITKHTDPSLLGYCSLIGCEDRVLVTCEDGNVLLFMLGVSNVRELGRFRVGGAKSQILSHPAVAGKKYYVRTSEGIEAWQLASD